MQYVLRMGQDGSTDSSRVGGKFAVLSELRRGGFNVPPGYGLTIDAFQEHVRSAVPENLLNELYALARSDPTSEEFSDRSREVAGCVKNSPLTPNILEQVMREYDELVSNQTAIKGKDVSVRSSGVSEDSAKTSFAGQFDTALYVRREDVARKVVSVFSSYFRPSALRYMLEAEIDISKSALPVCVIRMVPDIRTSAVVFTKHPISKDPNIMSVDFTWGQGEALAQGFVTPDNATYNKKDMAIAGIRIGRKEKMVTGDISGPKRVSIPEEHITRQSCSEDELEEIFKIAKSVEEKFGCPQDLEMAISGLPFDTNVDSRIWVLQARPITT